MKRNARQRGQVMLEYALMLTLMVFLALALLAMYGAFSAQGSRMIDLVSHEVP